MVPHRLIRTPPPDLSGLLTRRTSRIVRHRGTGSQCLMLPDTIVQSWGGLSVKIIFKWDISWTPSCGNWAIFHVNMYKESHRDISVHSLLSSLLVREGHEQWIIYQKSSFSPIMLQESHLTHETEFNILDCFTKLELRRGSYSQFSSWAGCVGQSSCKIKYFCWRVRSLDIHDTDTTYFGKT